MHFAARRVYRMIESAIILEESQCIIATVLCYALHKDPLYMPMQRPASLSEPSPRRLDHELQIFSLDVSLPRFCGS